MKRAASPGTASSAAARPDTSKQPRSLADRFRGMSDALTDGLGRPWALLAAVGLIGLWGLTGPVFGFSDTWQLVINTATTIVTFLMVFVIQTSQNRQARAMHFKLDELIRSLPAARNALIEAEKATQAEERRRAAEFERAASRGRQAR